MPNIFHNSLSLGYPQGGTYETDPYIPQMTDYTAPNPFVAKASSNWDS